MSGTRAQQDRQPGSPSRAARAVLQVECQAGLTLAELSPCGGALRVCESQARRVSFIELGLGF